jgi:hypothetical protein
MDITAGRLESMNQRSWLMVTNYGADASGAVNADAAIQLALNDARDTGGAWVLVPPGTYLIGATLRIYNNTRLTLMQGAEFRRNHGGTMMLNGDAGQAFGGYTGNGDITIEGGLWNMRGTTPGMTGSAMCISIGHAENITIRDLEIRDLPGYHGIELNSTIHGTIADCRFRGYIDPGGRDFSEAVQLDLAKGAGEFGGFGPYDHTPCEDITVTGCYFGGSGTAGTTAWPRGVGSHSATITKYHRRIRISDCAFEGVLQYGVSAYNWEDLTVTGNTFNSCGSAVRCRSVIKTDTEDTKLPDGTQTNESQVMRNITVTGNTMREGLGYDAAIIVRGEVNTGTVLNVTIVGNAMDTTTAGQAGIQMVYVSRATVGDNVIANVDGTGVSGTNLNNVNVDGNVIWRAASYGVTMNSSDNSNVLNNQIRDPGKGGVYAETASDIQVRGNFIQGAAFLGGTYSGIRYFGTNSNLVTSGNKVRRNPTGTNAESAYNASSTSTALSRYGNDFRPGSGTWAAGAIQETAGNVQTVATDITT